MKHKPLDFKSTIDTSYVDITMTLSDLKILHNACVDIVNRHPEMIQYRHIVDKIGMVIDDHTFSAEHDLPF